MSLITSIAAIKSAFNQNPADIGNRLQLITDAVSNDCVYFQDYYELMASLSTEDQDLLQSAPNASLAKQNYLNTAIKILNILHSTKRSSYDIDFALSELDLINNSEFAQLEFLKCCSKNGWASVYFRSNKNTTFHTLTAGFKLQVINVLLEKIDHYNFLLMCVKQMTDKRSEIIKLLFGKCVQNPNLINQIVFSLLRELITEPAELIWHLKQLPDVFHRSHCLPQMLINEMLEKNTDINDQMVAELGRELDFYALSTRLKIPFNQTLKLLHKHHAHFERVYFNKYNAKEKIGFVQYYVQCRTHGYIEAEHVYTFEHIHIEPSMMFEYILQSFVDKASIDAHKFLIYLNIINTLCEANLSKEANLRLFKLLLPICTHLEKPKDFSLLRFDSYALEQLQLDFDAIRTPILEAELNGFKIVSKHEAQNHNKLLEKFNLSELLQIYHASKNPLEGFKVPFLKANEDNIPEEKRLLIKLLKLRVANDATIDLQNPGLISTEIWERNSFSLDTLVKDLTELTANADHLPYRIAKLYASISETLGESHILVKVAKIIPNTELTNLDMRKKVANMLLWIRTVLWQLFLAKYEYSRLYIETKLHVKVLETLLQLPDDQLRSSLTEDYFRVLNNLELLDCFNRLLAKLPTRTYCFAITLFRICQNDGSVDKASYDAFFEKVLVAVKSGYDDANALILAQNALKLLIDCDSIIRSDKIKIIDMILNPITLKILPIQKYATEDQAIMAATQCVANFLGSDRYKTSLLVFPVTVQGKNEVMISHIDKFSRALSSCNAIDVKLSDQIHNYIQRKSKAEQKIYNALHSHGFIKSQFKREIDLWLRIHAIAVNEQTSLLKKYLEGSSIDEASLELLFDTLELPNIPGVKQEFIQKILNAAESAAIFSYMAFSKSRSYGQYFNHYSQLKLLVANILTANFLDHKYAMNPHVELISKHSDKFQAWRENHVTDLKSFNQENSIQDLGIIDLQGFLYDRIVIHKHLPQIDFGTLFRWFETDDIQLKEQIFEDLSLVIEYNKDTTLTRNILSLVHSKDLDALQIVSTINTILGTLHADHPYFINDLLFLKNYFTDKVSGYAPIRNLEGCTIRFTDDWWLMLMMGTHVASSCLNLYNAQEPSLNLLANIISPHVKAIAIVNKENRTIMRAIVRLYYNCQANDPVVHLEKIYYANGCPTFLKETMYKYAEYIAKYHLQCDLVVSNIINPQLTKYNNQLIVSFIPGNLSEYVDALRGACLAPYVVHNSWCLFNYEKYRTNAQTNTNQSKVDEVNTDTRKSRYPKNLGIFI